MKVLFVVAVLLIVAVAPATAAAGGGATWPGKLGDVNRDGRVDSSDALIIQSCDGGISTRKFCPMNCGDVNGDHLVNSTDALIILSYDVGLPVPYPLGRRGCPIRVQPCPVCCADY